jgi:DNA-binding response OmpR family regulator
MSSPTTRLLVVDDDESVRTMLLEYLDSHGYAVRAVADGAAMRAALEEDLPDLVLLDLRLPGEDGLTLARYLREHFDVGIVMVTGSADVVDRVVGLELGADDYIAKPFDPRELLARLKSLLRRVEGRGAPGRGKAAGGARAAANTVRVGQCTLDLSAHRLLDAQGEEVALTSMEFDLLRVFSEHPNQVLSRDQLLTHTRNREWEPFDRSIDIRIARLRKKIEPDPEKPRYIKTIRGAGYLFVPSAD